MLTAFERIPELFVQRYEPAVKKWAADLKGVGTRVAIRLNPPLEPPLLSRDPRRIVGVVLTVTVERNGQGVVTRVVVRPADAANEEAIQRHVADLRRLVLN